MDTLKASNRTRKESILEIEEDNQESDNREQVKNSLAAMLKDLDLQAASDEIQKGLKKQNKEDTERAKRISSIRARYCKPGH